MRVQVNFPCSIPKNIANTSQAPFGHCRQCRKRKKSKQNEDEKKIEKKIHIKNKSFALEMAEKETKKKTKV